MVECEQCGEEFDTERGLHIHQSQVHGGGGEEEETADNVSFDVGAWKLAAVILAVVLVVVAADAYILDSNLSEEKATGKAMDYLRENVKGGENATLLSTGTTNSSVYRMKVRAMGRTIDVFVTEDGEYMFFNYAHLD